MPIETSEFFSSFDYSSCNQWNGDFSSSMDVLSQEHFEAPELQDGEPITFEIRYTYLNQYGEKVKNPTKNDIKTLQKYVEVYTLNKNKKLVSISSTELRTYIATYGGIQDLGEGGWSTYQGNHRVYLVNNDQKDYQELQDDFYLFSQGSLPLKRQYIKNHTLSKPKQGISEPNNKNLIINPVVEQVLEETCTSIRRDYQDFYNITKRPFFSNYTFFDPQHLYSLAVTQSDEDNAARMRDVEGNTFFYFSIKHDFLKRFDNETIGHEMAHEGDKYAEFSYYDVTSEFQNIYGKLNKLNHQRNTPDEIAGTEQWCDHDRYTFELFADSRSTLLYLRKKAKEICTSSHAPVPNQKDWEKLYYTGYVTKNIIKETRKQIQDKEIDSFVLNRFFSQAPDNTNVMKILNFNPSSYNYQKHQDNRQEHQESRQKSKSIPLPPELAEFSLNHLPQTKEEIIRFVHALFTMSSYNKNEPLFKEIQGQILQYSTIPSSLHTVIAQYFQKKEQTPLEINLEKDTFNNLLSSLLTQDDISTFCTNISSPSFDQKIHQDIIDYILQFLSSTPLDDCSPQLKASLKEYCIMDKIDSWRSPEIQIWCINHVCSLIIDSQWEKDVISQETYHYILELTKTNTNTRELIRKKELITFQKQYQELKDLYFYDKPLPTSEENLPRKVAFSLAYYQLKLQFELHVLSLQKEAHCLSDAEFYHQKLLLETYYHQITSIVRSCGDNIQLQERKLFELQQNKQIILLQTVYAHPEEFQDLFPNLSSEDFKNWFFSDLTYFISNSIGTEEQILDCLQKGVNAHYITPNIQTFLYNQRKIHQIHNDIKRREVLHLGAQYLQDYYDYQHLSSQDLSGYTEEEKKHIQNYLTAIEKRYKKYQGIQGYAKIKQESFDKLPEIIALHEQEKVLSQCPLTEEETDILAKIHRY